MLARDSVFKHELHDKSRLVLRHKINTEEADLVRTDCCKLYVHTWAYLCIYLGIPCVDFSAQLYLICPNESSVWTAQSKRLYWKTRAKLGSSYLAPPDLSSLNSLLTVYWPKLCWRCEWDDEWMRAICYLDATPLQAPPRVPQLTCLWYWRRSDERFLLFQQSLDTKDKNKRK